MIFYQPAFIVACVIAVALYRAGQEEAKSGRRNHAWLWAGLSVAVSAVVLGIFKGGVAAVLIANVLLFLAIGVIRALQDRQ